MKQLCLINQKQASQIEITLFLPNIQKNFPHVEVGKPEPI